MSVFVCLTVLLLMRGCLDLFCSCSWQKLKRSPKSLEGHAARVTVTQTPEKETPLLPPVQYRTD